MFFTEKDNSLLYHFKEVTPNKKVSLCLFDLDSTLIQTKSGKVHPVDENDWKWFSEDVMKVLKEKYTGENQYICIVSNQMNLLEESKKKKRESFEKKIQMLEEEFKKNQIQMSYMIAVDDDYYRKPLTGTYEFIKEYIKKSGSEVVRGKSFYCGDACGRKGDFSSSDLYYSHNNKLEFYTPEHIFLNEENPSFSLPKRPYLECTPNPLPKLKTNSIFFLFITGSPSSGKTYLSEEYQKMYGGVLLESEKIKSKDKMKKKIIEDLTNFKSVIVVGTYPKSEDREEMIKIVKDLKKDIMIYGIEMTTNKELVQHLNSFRVEWSENKIKKIPIVAYRVYHKYHQKMELKEGYHQVFEYSPCIQFSNKKMEEVFLYYY